MNANEREFEGEDSREWTADHRSDGLLLKEEVFEIVGCAMEVLNEIGHGLWEKPYSRAFAVPSKGCFSSVFRATWPTFRFSRDDRNGVWEWIRFVPADRHGGTHSCASWRYSRGILSLVKNVFDRVIAAA